MFRILSFIFITLACLSFLCSLYLVYYRYESQSEGMPILLSDIEKGYVKSQNICLESTFLDYSHLCKPAWEKRLKSEKNLLAIPYFYCALISPQHPSHSLLSYYADLYGNYETIPNSIVQNSITNFSVMIRDYKIPENGVLSEGIQQCSQLRGCYIGTARNLKVSDQKRLSDEFPYIDLNKLHIIDVNKPLLSFKWIIFLSGLFIFFLILAYLFADAQKGSDNKGKTNAFYQRNLFRYRGSKG